MFRPLRFAAPALLAAAIAVPTLASTLEGDLDRLKTLYDDGRITQEQYDSQVEIALERHMGGAETRADLSGQWIVTGSSRRGLSPFSAYWRIRDGGDRIEISDDKASGARPFDVRNVSIEGDRIRFRVHANGDRTVYEEYDLTVRDENRITGTVMFVDQGFDAMLAEMEGFIRDEIGGPAPVDGYGGGGPSAPAVWDLDLMRR